MNHFSPGEANGYAETWQAYTQTLNYKMAMEQLIKKGVPKAYLELVLEDAFNAGWSLLISTFIRNITDNEKRMDKAAHIKHELKKV